MSNFKYSSTGLALTEKSEGLRLTAYQDPVGVWTIGYGHTGSDVVQGLTITDEQAAVLLAADVAWAVTCVNKSVKVAINQNQFDALVDFTFNLGCAAFIGSTLLRKLNAGDLAGTAAEFIRWNKAKGKKLAGLTKRRQAETDLFNTPIATMRAAGIALTAARAPKKSARKKAVSKTGARKAPAKKSAKKAKKQPE